MVTPQSGDDHAGRPVPHLRPRILRIDDPVRRRNRADVGGHIMEPLLGLAVAIALGIYLLFTLLHPERF